jgi:hypothetical protein
MESDEFPLPEGYDLTEATYWVVSGEPIPDELLPFQELVCAEIASGNIYYVF